MSKSDFPIIVIISMFFIFLIFISFTIHLIGSIFINPVTWVIIIMLLVVIIAYKVYEFFYYESEKFIEIKNRFQVYINDCNDLNEHIEGLKLTYANIEKTHYGVANLVDSSRYFYKRNQQINAVKSEFIYECSATICKNSEVQPFKYLCKYFNIKTDETTLINFENVLNNFSAAEEGKLILKEKYDSLKNSLKSSIPILISIFGMRTFMHKLGIQEIDFETVYFPIYSFRYISPGGNKSTRSDIKLDIENLNNFIGYLSEIVKFNKSVAGQRAFMNSRLREFIKKRDNYTCRKCGVSSRDESHLLLEIDHVIPVSKGGLTTENNLQTLCWKCNRTKGAKVAANELGY